LTRKSFALIDKSIPCNEDRQPFYDCECDIIQFVPWFSRTRRKTISNPRDEGPILFDRDYDADNRISASKNPLRISQQGAESAARIGAVDLPPHFNEILP
jgi:hypothetical protein